LWAGCWLCEGDCGNYSTVGGIWGCGAIRGVLKGDWALVGLELGGMREGCIGEVMRGGKKINLEVSYRCYS